MEKKSSMTKKLESRLTDHDKYVSQELSQEGRDNLKERATRFAIDTNNLTEEVARQPAEYAYFAHILATHETIAAKAKMRMEAREAEVKNALRGVDSRSGKSGGPTIDALNSAVKEDQIYLQCLADYRNALDRVAHLSADVNASAQKSTMLRLLGGMVQTETQMKGYSTNYGTEKTD